MIWMRRLAAVSLGVVFIWLALLLAGVFRVNATLLEPQFYIDQLRKGDVYNYLYDEVLPASLEEVDQEATDLPVELAPLEDEIMRVARESFPPEWIQQQVEQSIGEALPYFTGDSDSFEIRVPLADRVEASGEAFKDTVINGNVLDVVYEDAMVPQVIEIVENQGDLPFGVSLTDAEVDSAVREIVERQWLQGQIIGAVDELVPYLTKRQEDFAVRIELQSRAGPAAGVLRDVLDRGDTTQFVFDDMIDPVIEKEVGPLVELPFGVTVTDQEVQDAVREVLPPEWVEQRVSDTIDEAVVYLTDTQHQLSIVIPLEDRKAEAVRVVGEMADRKLEDMYASLPVCTAEQLAQMDIGRLADEGLECRLSGITIEGVQRIAGVFVLSSAESIINERLPDQWVFTESDLQERMSPDQFEALTQVREWLSRGYVYTAADLREDLAKADFPGGSDQWDALDEPTRHRLIEESDNVQKLDEARSRIADGLVYNQEDLETLIRENRGDNGFAEFDRARGWLGQARSLRGLGWVVFVGILGFVGLLGGRSIAGKLAWSATFLGIAGALLFALGGPVYDGFIESTVEDAINERLAVAAGIEEVLLSKSLEIALSANGEFFSSVKTQGLTYVIIAIVMSAAAVLWPLVFRRRRTQEDRSLEGAPTR